MTYLIYIAIMEKRYGILDILKKLRISRRTLHRWEYAKKIPEPRRDPMNNWRYYTEKDIKKIKKITGR